MLFKFILINQTNFCGLLELQIIFINNTLILEYSLYTIKNRDIIPMIEQSLYNNAESKTVVNSLGKELYRRGEMGLYEANEFSIACVKSFELNQNQPYIQIYFREFKIYVNPAQLRIIYNFIDMYCKNYDLILMQYQQSLNAQIIQQQQTPAVKNEEPLNNHLINHNNLIDDIVLFSPSKQIINYLFRQILNNKNSYCNVSDDIENNKYVIEFTSYLNIYKISFTKLGFSQFVQLFNDISIPQNDCISNSKNLFQTLYYIIKNNISASYKIEIQLCLALLFFYYCKIKNFDFNIYLNKKVIPNFLNFYCTHLQICLDQLVSFNKLKPISLILHNNYQLDNYSLDSSVENKIEVVVAKYKYLQDLDRGEFLKKVRNETVLYRNTEAYSNPPSQILTQTILDLNLLIKQNLIAPNEPTFNLDYYQIENRVITKPYQQLKKLIDNPTNSVLMINELHPILIKYSDILIHNIIPSLNKNRELIETNDSILILYKMFVVDHIIFEHQMFILYQIVIPYIYDIFEKNKFVDCFH